MRREPIDPFRKALLDPLKVDHLREKPINDMFELGTWAQKMARADDPFVNGMAKWGKMNVMDQQAFARLTSHFPAAEFEEIARVPFGINELLWRMHPDLFEDQERVEEWLKSESGTPFAVPDAARRPFSSKKVFGGGV